MHSMRGRGFKKYLKKNKEKKTNKNPRKSVDQVKEQKEKLKIVKSKRSMIKEEWNKVIKEKVVVISNEKSKKKQQLHGTGYKRIQIKGLKCKSYLKSIVSGRSPSP